MSRIDRGFYCNTGNTGKQKKVLVRAKKTPLTRVIAYGVLSIF